MAVWFSFSWLAKQTFFLILMYFFQCWLCNRFVSGQLLQAGRLVVLGGLESELGGAAMGLGLWESGLVLDWGRHGAAWHGGVYPRGCGSGTGRRLAVHAPSFLGPRRVLAGMWPCVDVWCCRVPTVVCPVGPPTGDVRLVRRLLLSPPGRGSQPGGISQGQLRAVTGISVSLM